MAIPESLIAQFRVTRDRANEIITCISTFTDLANRPRGIGLAERGNPIFDSLDGQVEELWQYGLAPLYNYRWSVISDEDKPKYAFISCIELLIPARELLIPTRELPSGPGVELKNLTDDLLPAPPEFPAVTIGGRFTATKADLMEEFNDIPRWLVNDILRCIPIYRDLADKPGGLAVADRTNSDLYRALNNFYQVEESFLAVITPFNSDWAKLSEANKEPYSFVRCLEIRLSTRGGAALRAELDSIVASLIGVFTSPQRPALARAPDWVPGVASSSVTHFQASTASLMSNLGIDETQATHVLECVLTFTALADRDGGFVLADGSNPPFSEDFDLSFTREQVDAYNRNWALLSDEDLFSDGEKELYALYSCIQLTVNLSVNLDIDLEISRLIYSLGAGGEGLSDFRGASIRETYIANLENMSIPIADIAISQQSPPTRLQVRDNGADIPLFADPGVPGFFTILETSTNGTVTSFHLRPIDEMLLGSVLGDSARIEANFCAATIRWLNVRFLVVPEYSYTVVDTAYERLEFLYGTHAVEWLEFVEGEFERTLDGGGVANPGKRNYSRTYEAYFCLEMTGIAQHLSQESMAAFWAALPKPDNFR